MRRNSVIDGLRVRQFDDIQDELSEMVDCRSLNPELLGTGRCDFNKLETLLYLQLLKLAN